MTGREHGLRRIVHQIRRRSTTAERQGEETEGDNTHQCSLASRAGPTSKSPLAARATEEMPAVFECAYCFHDLDTVTNDDFSPDLSKEAFEHIRACHPEKWELVRPSDVWVRKISSREIRPELLAE